MSASQPSGRIASLDIIRGAVMVLMAIDHVRVYAGVPAGGPTPAIFFTRWVTHFCAPAFVFLAGTSAFLYGRKAGSAGSLARFLITRGIVLVAMELTIIRLGWTFNVDYAKFTLAGVIWMLGWCMVLLATLVPLPAAIVGWIGLTIIFFQQAFSLVKLGPLYEFIYPAGAKPWEGMAILYVIVPWIGVMAAGYGFGAIMTRESAERNRLCLLIGLSATAVYLVAGCTMLVLHPVAPNAPPFLIRLLNQQKYPASQLFLMMTLGPTIALLPLAERARGWVAQVFETFGRVPMFYYLLHIPTIHLAALLVNLLRDGSTHQQFYATAPFAQVPEQFRWGLPLLYLVFAIVIALLYWPCRWYASRRPRVAWLRYI